MTDYHEDDAILIAALDSVRDAARNCFEHYDNQERLGTWLERPSPDIADVTKPVLAALGSHTRFVNGMSTFFGPKQLMLHPQYQAQNLLRLAVDRNAKDAVAWYHKIYSLDKADLRYVAEIYGLNVSNRITLSNGILLMPLEELPPSPNAQAVQAQFRPVPGGPNISFPFAIGATSQAYRVTRSLCLEEGASPRSDELERTIRAFTLVDGASPVVGVSWVDFADADLGRAEYGRMHSTPRYEGRKAFSSVDVDTAAIGWVETYLRLDPEVREACEVAIERLNLARRRLSPGNKAIDGAICLESLLLTDQENQELTYRLRLRAAMLLSSDLNERRQISNAVKDFYKLRSKTVHAAGSNPRDTGKYEEWAAQGLNICARVLREIISQNKQFDAETWELSGGYPPCSS
jgi:hypothetical protein